MTLSVDTIYTAAVADEQHTLADEATNGVFGTLADSTKGFTDRGVWEAEVRAFEDEYMEKTQKGNPDAKTKGSRRAKSRWKYAKYLPKAWSSSKSVCGQAIEHGIAIDAASGKTATETKIAEAKKSLKGEKTPKEKLAILQDSMRKVLAKMPDDERADALEALGVDVTKSIFNWI